MIGFIFYISCALLFVPIGISCLKSKEPVGFFAGVKPPDIPENNITKYNKAVAKLWFAFAVILGLLGIPILFVKQNSPIFLIPTLGIIILSIGICIVYLKIEKKYKEK